MDGQVKFHLGDGAKGEDTISVQLGTTVHHRSAMDWVLIAERILAEAKDASFNIPSPCISTGRLAEPGEIDEAYQRAVAALRARGDGIASTSFIQRTLRIGYNSAARLMERMEAEGIISTADREGRRRLIMEDSMQTSTTQNPEVLTEKDIAELGIEPAPKGIGPADDEVVEPETVH